MNNFTKEKAAETAAAAALVALLAAAIALGAMIQDRAESGSIAASLARMAERTLVPAGISVRVLPSPLRASLPVRRAFSITDRAGRRVGTGAAVVVEGYGWTGELLVLADERGRLVSTLPRNGASGIRSEELAVYLRQRERKASGGLDVSVDPRDLEFSVSRALEAALAATRDGLEETK